MTAKKLIEVALCFRPSTNLPRMRNSQALARIHVVYTCGGRGAP